MAGKSATKAAGQMVLILVTKKSGKLCILVSGGRVFKKVVCAREKKLRLYQHFRNREQL